MPQIDLVEGRRYVCRTVDDQRRLHAAFSVEGGDIRSYLVDFAARERGLFSEREHSILEEPLVLQSEEGWYISLFNSYSLGTHFFASGSEIESVSSNTAVIGHSPWARDALAKRVQFRLPEVERYFKVTDEYRRVAESDWRSYKFGRLFSVEMGDMVSDVRFVPTWTGGIKQPTSVDTIHGITLSAPKTLQEVGQILHSIERYFTSISGIVVKPADITVSQFTSDEESRAEENNHLIWNDLLFYRGRGGQVQAEEGVLSFPFLLARRSGVENLATCLKEWVANFQKLAEPSGLMALALERTHTVSPDRLLGATRWLEAVPGTEAKALISRAHAKEIGQLVEGIVRDRGYDKAIAGRARSAIGKVSLEDNEARFSRLVSEINRFYGGHTLEADAVAWLVEGFRMRGPMAHGRTIATPDFPTDLECTIYTVEAVSFLLLLKELPLALETKERIAEHSCVYGYRYGARGKKPSRGQKKT